MFNRQSTYSSLKTEPGEFPLVVTADFRRTSSTFQLEGPAVCVPLISSTGHGDAALHRVHYQEGKFALANLLVALLPKDPSICDPKYLYQLLMAKKNEFFVPLMQGTANVSLKERDIANVEISLPTLEYQQRIVARIEELAARIEEARELRSRAIEENDVLFRKVLKKAFEPFFEKTVAIGDAFKVTTGGTPSRANPLFWEGDIKWVSSGEVAFCRIKDTVERITELGVKNSNAHLYPPNTVLIAMIGQGKTRGQCAILDCHATTNQNIAGIHVYETEHLPEFVYWWLFSRYYESRLAEIGTAQPALSGTRVKQMPIPLPQIHEQCRVVNYLNDIQSKLDALKRHQAETAAELDALLPAVLERAFRGEL